jgi:hypothetical protein
MKPYSRCEFILRSSTVVLFAGCLNATTAAADQNAELAKKLANPIAALISVPFQLNYNQDIGPADDGTRWTLNFQPVIPIELNQDWNIISRTILPIVSQNWYRRCLSKLFLFAQGTNRRWLDLGCWPGVSVAHRFRRSIDR